MFINWYKLAKVAKHHYSWVYINLPKDISEKLIEFGKQIDPEDLFENEGDNGLELDPHITVKYGLLTDDYSKVKECLSDPKGGKVYMGKSSIFEGKEYDVVKISVESDALRKLHEKLNKLPHEDKHIEYRPHATIAYVKSGRGKKYDGKFNMDQEFNVKSAYFDDKKRDHKIRLGGSWFAIYKTS